jgi:hypothetical protein
MIDVGVRKEDGINRLSIETEIAVSALGFLRP